MVAAGLIDQVVDLNPLAAYQVVDAIPANPTEAATREGVACFRDAECDGIITVGGGSPIDLAKAIRDR